jgi:hypothetical protein
MQKGTADLEDRTTENIWGANIFRTGYTCIENRRFL